MTTDTRASEAGIRVPDPRTPTDTPAGHDLPNWRRSLLTVAAALLPGLGHLLLGHRRAGAALLGGFLLAVAALAVAAVRIDRSELLRSLFSSGTLAAATAVCVAVAIGWSATIVRAHLLTRPRRFRVAQRVIGAGLVVALCAAVVVPLGFAANLANSQRVLLDSVFAVGGAGDSGRGDSGRGDSGRGDSGRGDSGRGDDPAAVPATPLPQPRLNLLLLGTDDGPDRFGARTDTMIVASVDTDTAETILFALPRNLQDSPFPPGSPAHARFPDGFDDLLNAVYPYGVAHADIAPAGPTTDPGINLLMSAIEQMLALPLHHHVRVDMTGLAAIVDAVGGVTVNVGPQPLPIGGVTPSGRLVEPEGYIEPGTRHLDGREALWFARARRNSSDYDRMARQRCLIDAVLSQNGPAELLLRFRAVADAATDHISTGIPRTMLPALVSLVEQNGGPRLRAVSFDPDLPDPTAPGGTFRPADPDLDYMRRVVDAALTEPTANDAAADVPATGGPDTAGAGEPATAVPSARAAPAAPSTPPAALPSRTCASSAPA